MKKICEREIYNCDRLLNKERDIHKESNLIQDMKYALKMKLKHTIKHNRIIT